MKYNYKLYTYNPKELSSKLIERFIKIVDNDFIPKFSTRVNICDYSKKLSNYAHHICIKNDTEIIGLASFYFNKYPKDTYWTFFAVEAKYRRVGIGIQIEKELIKYCKTNKTSSIVGEVRASNKLLLKFHEAFGFITHGIKENTNDTEEKVNILLQIKDS